MKTGTLLRLSLPTIAVFRNEKGEPRWAGLLAAGTIFEIHSELTAPRTQVKCNGEFCEMFSADLRERGELVRRRARHA
jgi:hypothetical protein